MITTYTYDSNGVYVGTVEIDEFGPIVSNITFTPLPELPEGGSALWNGDTWEIFPSQEEATATSISRKTSVITQAQYVAALEHMYDTVAQTHRYDNRMTCALRAGYPGPYQAEALAFATWMDTCNYTAYGLMIKVLSGQMAKPTIPELLALMPEIEWPT